MRSVSRRGVWGTWLVAVIAIGCGSPDRHGPDPRAQPGTTARPQEPLTIFAATSLRDVADELASVYPGPRPLTFNFAGSNVLAQQIASSDRGDVFLSADERWVSELETQRRVVPGTKRWFLSNTLVVVAHASSRFALAAPADLPTIAFEHLALADPEAVPAGRYAKAYLASLRYRTGTVWSAVESRVAPAADVRAALALVAADAETVGIVYRTDVRSADVRTLYAISEDDLPTRVRYYAVAIANRPNVDAAREFVEFLGTADARAVFEAAGFLSPQLAP